MRDLYLARASEASGVDRAILQREVDSPARRGERSSIAPSLRGGEPDIGQSLPEFTDQGDRPGSYSGTGGSAERELIRAMLDQRSRVAEIAEKIGSESFRDPRYRRIFARLLEADETTPLDQVVGGLAESDLSVIEELLSEAGAQIDPQRTVHDSLTAIRVRELDEEMMDIEATLPLASDEQKDPLMRRRMELNEELNSLSRPRYKKFRVRSKTTPERD
jgi:hypothetical protein